jgi:hypothetical protein
MKTILTLFTIVTLVSCYEPKVGMDTTTIDSTGVVKEDTTFSQEIPVNFSSIPLYVVVVDNCEYLYGPWGNASVLTHKGNCKYCAERKQEKKVGKNVPYNFEKY